jgi:hypothetical protein
MTPVNYIIHADGSVDDYQPADGKHYTLQELQCAVGGGHIELVRSGTGSGTELLVVDEEGKLKGFPINWNATLIYGNSNDVLVGDVLVCDEEMIE